MHYLKIKKPLAFFDLETTGVNPVTDRIVEIAIVKAMPNGELLTKVWKVNPTIPIPLESSAIHGIYDKDVANEPTFKQLAKTVEQFLEGADLAGFNICKFDIPLLVEEFLRADVNFDVSNRKIADAQKIFHLMEPRTLSAAYKFYCGDDITSLGGNAHSAEIDTLATYHVLNEQIKRYEGKSIKDSVSGRVWTPVANDMDALHQLSTSNTVDLAGRMAYNAKGEAVFTFGKHKDRPVAEVLQKEPSYYDWMMKGDFPLETKRRLTELKLKMSQLNR
ncbi:DNA polymerase-3 subunit epsilon [Flexibacter flexilis DSM 6793]|uniref:DNA polymerase-3 subunit epsilon n=1 Tax=Flexibacter flexilis DSM 6793 TaxID=927664 RepID=A0A1I1FVJ3_9BACT|nr:3'-5' exonuclease [Flexibacter flexilis]SFC03052.1 DNA polymerase-3 subunit epsilon [Flexibacter flexilis DSM 6793]